MALRSFHLGNNEYRFKMKKDMQHVLERDDGQMPPICQSQAYEPPDPSFLPFYNLKAPSVLHLLDRQLGKSGTTLASDILQPARVGIRGAAIPDRMDRSNHLFPGHGEPALDYLIKPQRQTVL